jgi:hypothetical protein
MSFYEDTAPRRSNSVSIQPGSITSKISCCSDGRILIQ